MMHKPELLLQNRLVTLSLLQNSHLGSLESVINDGALYNNSYTMIPRPENLNTYISQSIREHKNDFSDAFVIEHLPSKLIVGFTKILHHKEIPSCVEIASTFIRQSFQRQYINSNTKLLLLEYLFEVQKVHRVNFTVNALNLVSQKALQSIGAKKIADIQVRRQMPDWEHSWHMRYTFSKQYWQNHKKRLKRDVETKSLLFAL